MSNMTMTKSKNNATRAKTVRLITRTTKKPPASAKAAC